MAHPDAADPARPLPDRAPPDPDRRPVRVLRIVGLGRLGDQRHGLPEARADPALAAAVREPRWQPGDARANPPVHARSCRPSGPGRRATRSTGSTGSRRPATATSRSRSSTSSRRPTPGSSSTSIGASSSGSGDDSTVEVAVRAAAAVADKALVENRAVGMTVNAHRLAQLMPDRGGRQHLKVMQLLAAVEGDGSTPARGGPGERRLAHPPGHDRDRHHAVA